MDLWSWGSDVNSPSKAKVCEELEVSDHMIAKEDHIEYLLKLFQRLRKFKLHLNPNKCTFGVRSGKQLGFIVIQKDIEVDPNKVKAIREIPTPKTEKQVSGFLDNKMKLIEKRMSYTI